MAGFTLKDEAVQNFLQTLSILGREIPNLRLVIAGGIAAQAYSPSPSFYRSDSDIDVLSQPVANQELIRHGGLGDRILEILSCDEYNVLGNKTIGHVYITMPQQLPVEIRIFSPQYLEQHRWVQREIDNAREIQLTEMHGYPIKVQRIEDILANKARKISKYVSLLTPEMKDELGKLMDGDFEALNSSDLARRLEATERTRTVLFDEARIYHRCPSLDLYRVAGDLYDIALLSRAIVEGRIPFDIAYFRIALATISRHILVAENDVGLLEELKRYLENAFGKGIADFRTNYEDAVSQISAIENGHANYGAYVVDCKLPRTQGQTPLGWGINAIKVLLRVIKDPNLIAALGDDTDLLQEARRLGVKKTYRVGFAPPNGRLGERDLSRLVDDLRPFLQQN